jgi:pimeloyl-ACP methyl ester carboxylesterase
MLGRDIVNAPPLSRLVIEPMAVLECGTFLTAVPLLYAIPRGNGHPVLVLPGFAASDQSTVALRRMLRWHGHAVYGWGLGHNVGAHPHIVQGMRRRLDDLHHRHAATVSLVGWSLGGVFARELARRQPDAVRQVITLASPFRLRTGDQTNATWLYDMVAPADDPVYGLDTPEQDRPPLPVPTTAIYTRTDGIVRWHACIESAGPHRENIRVHGTHNGLGFNVAAIIAVADRLAQPAGSWRPFRPPPGLRDLYPPAVTWRLPPNGDDAR